METIRDELNPFLQILAIRQSLVPILQPRVRKEASSLADELRTSNSHPYLGISKGVLSKMCDWSCLGPKAKPNASETPYLYRIHDVQLPSPPEQSGVMDVSDFQPLSDFYIGPIHNNPGTFWTCYDLSRQQIQDPRIFLDLALSLGMLHAYTEHLILRLPVSKAIELGVTVPTEIDGFDHMPYMPTAFNDTPSSGTTLDLSQMPQLGPGRTEYIVANVKAEDVDFRALRFDVRDFGKAKRLRNENPADSTDAAFLIPARAAAESIQAHLAESFGGQALQ